MPNMTASRTASQALRRWRRRKEGFGMLIIHPVLTHILERVPETPGTRGQPWALALCFAGQAVEL